MLPRLWRRAAAARLELLLFWTYSHVVPSANFTRLFAPGDICRWLYKIFIPSGTGFLFFYSGCLQGGMTPCEAPPPCCSSSRHWQNNNEREGEKILVFLFSFILGERAAEWRCAQNCFSGCVHVCVHACQRNDFSFHVLLCSAFYSLFSPVFAASWSNRPFVEPSTFLQEDKINLKLLLKNVEETPGTSESCALRDITKGPTSSVWQV